MKPLAEVAALMVDELIAEGRLKPSMRKAAVEFATATAKCVPEFRGTPREEKLYDCPLCKDSGWAIHQATVHDREYDRAWYCTCPKGVTWELRHWFAAIYFPLGRGKWGEKRKEMGEFEEYIREGKWPQTKFLRKKFDEYADERKKRKGE